MVLHLLYASGNLLRWFLSVHPKSGNYQMSDCLINFGRWGRTVGVDGDIRPQQLFIRWRNILAERLATLIRNLEKLALLFFSLLLSLLVNSQPISINEKCCNVLGTYGCLALRYKTKKLK